MVAGSRSEKDALFCVGHLSFALFYADHQDQCDHQKQWTDEHDGVVSVAADLDEQTIEIWSNDGRECGEKIIEAGECAKAGGGGQVNNHGQGIDVDERPGNSGRHEQKADNAHVTK
jgi:hypothetical protein